MLAGLIGLLALAVAPVAAAQIAARPGDEVFLISTRHLPSCPVADVAGRVSVIRLDGRTTPGVAPAAELFAGAGGRRTIVHVDGNRVSYQDSVNYGCRMYRALTESPNAPPFRLVIWSWPADEIRGPLRDVQVKADRADVEGTFLGQVLPRLDQGGGLSLSCFSFGARIVAGGLARSPRPAQVAMLSAAIDRDRLCPTGLDGRAIGPGVNVLNFFNSQDSALRHYRLLGRDGGGAAGYEGWPCCGTCGGTVTQYDAACHVGRTHSLSNYLDAPSLRASLRQHLLPTP